MKRELCPEFVILLRRGVFWLWDLDLTFGYIFAIGNVGDRAQSCCQRRPCEIAGWLIVDAASSTSVALLQLLVVDVVVVCNLL